MTDKPTDEEDLSQYDPILLKAGIRAPIVKSKYRQGSSPASKAALRKHRAPPLLFGKRDKR